MKPDENIEGIEILPNMQMFMQRMEEDVEMSGNILYGEKNRSDKWKCMEIARKVFKLICYDINCLKIVIKNWAKFI